MPSTNTLHSTPITSKSFIRRHRRVTLLMLGAAVFAFIGCVALLSWRVAESAADLTSDTYAALPKRRVGLVLGCAQYTKDGRLNLFYRNRIRAAAELYHAGIVECLLVSGDNHTKGYDEATDMKNSLIRAGVPAAAITCDYAGFRTLDSIIRAHTVFGLNEFIVISQRFHNERAIYIARQLGLNVAGYNARDVGGAEGLLIQLREHLARARTVLDLHVLGTQPKFLGPPVSLGTAAE